MIDLPRIPTLEKHTPMSTRKSTGVGRRQFLKASAATALAGAVQAAGETPLAAPAKASTLIADENRKPGTFDWQLTRVRLDKQTGVRASVIEGYCSRQSVLAGESLHIFVGTNPLAKFHIEIFRTGYYGGRRPRFMNTLRALDWE